MRPGEWRRRRPGIPAAAASRPVPRGGGAGRTGRGSGGGGWGGCPPSPCRGLRAPHPSADWLQTDNGAGPAFRRPPLAAGAAPPPPIGESEWLSLAGPARPCPVGRRPARAGVPSRPPPGPEGWRSAGAEEAAAGGGWGGVCTVTGRPFPPGPAVPAREPRPAGEKPHFQRYFQLSVREGAVSGAELPSRPGSAPGCLLSPRCWRCRGPDRLLGTCLVMAPSGLTSPRHASSRRRTSACERRRVVASPGQGAWWLAGREGGRVPNSALLWPRVRAKLGAKLHNLDGLSPNCPAYGARPAPQLFLASVWSAGRRGDSPPGLTFPPSCDAW